MMLTADIYIAVETDKSISLVKLEEKLCILVLLYTTPDAITRGQHQ